MRDSRRKNKNTGTSKRGYKRQSSFVIPESYHCTKVYFEKLSKYTKVTRIINNIEYVFIVEAPSRNCCHACTVDDIHHLLSFVDPPDLEGLKYIVLRQPKKKERILSPVWGRLVYSFELTDYEDSFPAIILESIDYSEPIIKSVKLSVDERKEYDRLIKDGYQFSQKKKKLYATPSIDLVRSTQLYRTVLHEIGHYVHYLNFTERPFDEIKQRVKMLETELVDWDNEGSDPFYDEWDSLTEELSDKKFEAWEKYDAIPSKNKEDFAHRYAGEKEKQFKENNITPFARIFDEASMKNDGISPINFMLD